MASLSRGARCHTQNACVTPHWRAASKTLITNQCDSATTSLITLCHTSRATTGTHPIRVCRCHTGTLGEEPIILPRGSASICCRHVLSAKRGGGAKSADLGWQVHPGYQYCWPLWHGRLVPIVSPDLTATPHPNCPRGFQCMTLQLHSAHSYSSAYRTRCLYPKHERPHCGQAMSRFNA